MHAMHLCRLNINDEFKRKQNRKEHMDDFISADRDTPHYPVFKIQLRLKRQQMDS